MSIKLTEISENQIRRLLIDKKEDGIRIKVRGGGCSGLMYELDFEDVATEDDIVYYYEDVKVYVDMKSLLYINNLELDYEDGLNGKGFVFINANATSTCGCGESFSI